MKQSLLPALICMLMLSCAQQGKHEKTAAVSPDTTAGQSLSAGKENEDTEIIETFTDSTRIGEKGQCKIELIKHRVLDHTYVIVKYYTRGPRLWHHQHTYLYECDAIMDFHPELADFNHDTLNDLTFVSATAARGANEVRRLFIYDKDERQLVPIVNAQDFPNLRYNKQLDCIDAFLVHGTATTVFANIIGDSLKAFAFVYNGMDFHTVAIVDQNGNEKEISKVKGKGPYTRFRNFRPLEVLDAAE
ncbi:MAG: hypothetical protein JNL13_09515 [Chitinophagaceae bacterium]|nr:hypothetical protein [Chitinophagaceae bacterium]